jgi:hypothetical protein
MNSDATTFSDQLAATFQIGGHLTDKVPRPGPRN